MSLPSYIGSRTEWDKEQKRQLREACRGNPDKFRRRWERRYPVCVTGAIEELKQRGLHVTEDKIGLYCNLNSLNRIGRNYVFYPDDIDDLAETLVGWKKFTGLALRRKNDGIGYAEELEAVRHVLRTRYQRIADAIGVSVDEFHAAVRVGGVILSAFDEVDIDAAKAWFAAHAQDEDYQRELHLQEVV